MGYYARKRALSPQNASRSFDLGRRGGIWRTWPFSQHLIWGKVKLWEVEKGYSLETFQAQAGCLWSLSFSPGGRSIAVGGDDLAIKQWKVESVQGKESARFIRNFLWVHHDGLVSSFQS